MANGSPSHSRATATASEFMTILLGVRCDQLASNSCDSETLSKPRLNSTAPTAAAMFLWRVVNMSWLVGASAQNGTTASASQISSNTIKAVLSASADRSCARREASVPDPRSGAPSSRNNNTRSWDRSARPFPICIQKTPSGNLDWIDVSEHSACSSTDFPTPPIPHTATGTLRRFPSDSERMERKDSSTCVRWIYLAGSGGAVTITGLDVGSLVVA